MKNIYKALADFQQEVPVIGQATSGYGYKYADLPTIFKTINPLLKKNGLAFTQGVDGTALKTVLFHIESGETITTKAEIPQNVKLGGMNAYQSLGSAITYMRRYSIASMLGLVTDEDMDAKTIPAPVVKPKPVVKAKVILDTDTEYAKNVLRDSKDLAELQKRFTELDKDMKPLVNSVKEEMKTKLSK
jgi:hypothetical protein